MMAEMNLCRGRRFNGLTATRGHIFLLTLLCVFGSVILLDTKEILDVVKSRNEKTTESLKLMKAKLQFHEDFYRAWMSEYGSIAESLYALEESDPSTKPHLDSMKESMKQARGLEGRFKEFYDQVKEIEEELDRQNKQIKCLEKTQDKL